MQNAPHLAFFISPHGFGHAARSAAVMSAFCRLMPESRVTALTTVPEFLFEDLPVARFELVPFTCDVGLAQKTPTVIDFSATVARLDAFWKTREAKIRQAADLLTARGCTMVVCDIAPLGILAAKRAGLPAALLENFTWDWIYRGLPEADGALDRYAEIFAKVFETADLRIQSEPVCQPCKGCSRVEPIARPIRTDRWRLRETLGLDAGDRAVLITMGGLAEAWGSLAPFSSVPELTFLLPGLCGRDRNVIGLGEGHAFYHPDWVSAADLVVGKLGYSTVTEVIQAGTPMAFLDRPDFPESKVLADYLQSESSLAKIDSFTGEAWVDSLREWVSLPRRPARTLAGARQAAEILRAFQVQSSIRTTISD